MQNTIPIQDAGPRRRQPQPWMLALAIFGLTVPMSTTQAASQGVITSYTIQNLTSKTMRNVPVTFGAVFAKGDVPAKSSISAIDGNGDKIPLQADVKARNPDGSLRHAVVTIDVRQLPAGGNMPVRIVTGQTAAGSAINLAALPSNFDAVVELTAGGKKLRVSARDLLAQNKPTLWLTGPLVTEWWVSGPLRDANGTSDPHLSVQFGIRSYGNDRPLRVEVDVENDWTWVHHPMTEFYDAVIRMNGKEVFAKTGMAQTAHTRWRKVFWWDDSVNVNVKQDLSYLKKTRVVPNYASNARDLNSEIAQLYRRFESSDRGPLGNGIITAYMPTTGGRQDIGPLPGWTVLYLLTMDPRAAEVTMSSADLSGSFAAHYRNIKTGRPTTTEEYPQISTHSNFVGRPGNLEIPDAGGYKTTLHPDSDHEPSLDFIPYVVTGERYYLEELQFWSQWNSWGTGPGYHGGAKNLFYWDDVRGQAWSLRTLAQAAYITPDGDPMKATLVRELKANADWYNANYTNNPHANIFHTAQGGSHHRDIATWMDDFITWAASYAVDLGFDDWKPFAEWKAVFPVQRMINPDFCWILATPYYMQVENNDGSPITSWASAFTINFAIQAKRKGDLSGLECGSQRMAFALGQRNAGEMLGSASSGGGYTANLQPALAAAVDLGVPGAKEAWSRFEARAVKPKSGIDPWWNIVPRSPGD